MLIIFPQNFLKLFGTQSVDYKNSTCKITGEMYIVDLLISSMNF